MSWWRWWRRTVVHICGIRLPYCYSAKMVRKRCVVDARSLTRNATGYESRLAWA